jgi:hypothetical protein
LKKSPLANLGCEPYPAENIDGIVKVMNDYFTTVGVVAALILTITTPILMQKMEFSDVVVDVLNDDINADIESRSRMNIALITLMNASQLSSLLATLTSFSLYVNLNVVMVDSEDRLWFIRENSTDVCEVFLVLSLVCLAFSIPLGVFIVFGYKTAFISAGMLSLACVWFARFIFNIVNKNHHRLRPKFLKAGEDLDIRLNRLKNEIFEFWNQENEKLGAEGQEPRPVVDRESVWDAYQVDLQKVKLEGFATKPPPAARPHAAVD